MTEKTPQITVTAVAGPAGPVVDLDHPAIQYQVSLEIQTPKMDEPKRWTLTGWRIGDWLAPGAYKDVDGSPRSGDTQWGGWFTADTDGCENGLPRLDRRSAYMGQPGESIEIDSGGAAGEPVFIDPGDIPDWEELRSFAERLEDQRDAAEETDEALDAALEAALDAAEDYRRALADAIDEALDEMEPPDFPEPEPEDVLDGLGGDEIDDLEALPVWVGRWNCSAPLLVWRDDEGQRHYIYHPTPEDADRVAAELATALAKEIADAIKSESAD